MSLLSIVQQAFGEIGLTPPASVATNTDPQVIKALALCNRSGIDVRDADGASQYWPALRKQFLFNLAGVGPLTGTFTSGSNQITNVTGAVLTNSAPPAGQLLFQINSQYVLNDTWVTAISAGPPYTVTMSQNCSLTATGGPSGNGVATDTAVAFGQEAYPLPADLNYWLDQTGWDRNFRWQLLGPVNAQEWQVLKSGISPVGPRLRYRLMAGQIYINPAPYVPTGQSGPITDLIVMEYASLNWVTPIGGTTPTQQGFILDTDTASAVFPEDMITLSLKWRMLRALGMQYGEEFQDYTDWMDRQMGRQTMGRNLPLNARASGIRLLNSQNVPDTGFGS